MTIVALRLCSRISGPVFACGKAVIDRLRLRDESAHDLACPTQYQEADTDNDCTRKHDRPPSPVFTLALVRQYADYRLHNQPRERSGYPD